MTPHWPRRAPNPWVWAFPLTYLLHIAEEYGSGEGFPSWASRFTGLQFTPVRFLAVNAIVWCAMCVGCALIVRRASFRWLLPALAAAVTLNGVAHLVATVATRSYPPGLLTGLLCWIPLGIVTLHRTREELRAGEYWWGVASGFGFHALVTLSAFLASRD